MSHDPMCDETSSSSEYQTAFCVCDLICRIRENERQNIKEYVLRLKPRNRIWILRSFKRKELCWNLGVEWAVDVSLNHPTLKSLSRQKEVKNEYR